MCHEAWGSQVLLLRLLNFIDIDKSWELCLWMSSWYMSGREKPNDTERETWSSRFSPGEGRARSSDAAPDGDAGSPLGEGRGLWSSGPKRSKFWVPPRLAPTPSPHVLGYQA